MYFLQDSFLFHKVNFGHSRSPLPSFDYYDVINSIVSLVTRFNWGIFSRAGDFCVTKGATSVVNQSMMMLQAPMVIFMFSILIAVWQLVLRKRIRGYRAIDDQKTEIISQVLWHGLLLTLLLTFQGHVLETATLVKCVTCYDESFLYINGNISCTQPWQYAVYLYLALWLAPFSIMLTFGKYYLFNDQEITMSKFVMFCLCPLPTSIYIITLLLIAKIRGIPSTKIQTEDNSNPVVKFFQNSQKDLPFLLDYLCCHGVVVMCRFAMVMLYTFNDDVMAGLLGTLMVVFLKLLYTLIALPYSSMRYIDYKQ